MNACRRALAAAILAGITFVAASSPTAAQQVIMLVNGDPITAYDVEQRTRLLQLVTKKAPPRKEVLDELVDEKLKLQLIRRFDFSSFNLDNDVESQLTRMARDVNHTKQQFVQELEKSGVQISTLKSRIKAQMVWTQVIRGKFQSSYQFNDEEILKAAGSKKEDEVGYDYTLRPITFVVKRGSPQSVFEARKREAEGLRVRFQNCADGIAFTRGLHDVAVQNQVVRSSADLAPQLREILEKTEVGKLTPPEVTMQNVEVYALCGKKPSRAENSPMMQKAKNELFSQRFEANARRYLKELRDQAYIVYK